LFNTLNTISGLVRLEQKEGAVHALSELSKMFRKVLENQKNQLASLKNEMEFIDSYLNIQKIRFENKLAVKIDIQPECMDAELPFMLLHTLVENAVQHGSQLESDENLLHLKVEREDSNLHIELTNKVSINDDHKGFGIGLKNCRKRLKHIYSDSYTLDCFETDDGHYKTTLKLPIGISDA
jgi:LytS/YehU family sensor histidine kinase